MITLPEGNFHHIEKRLGAYLLDAPEVDVGEWHSQKVDNPMLISRELRHVVFQMPLHPSQQALSDMVQPNQPWAEEHFLERVSGKPMNPPPSSLRWGAVGEKDTVLKHMKAFDGDGEEKFSHTYPERFWPKFSDGIIRYGIRFAYGDLKDVVKQLAANPYTRQAYLPVWFPEDTGAVHGERVPCTLGYHFLIRKAPTGLGLEVTYMIRSCDFLRHFRDDVYLAGRLGQWVAETLRGVATLFQMNLQVQSLTMHIMSLHVFNGDKTRMERDYGEAK